MCVSRQLHGSSGGAHTHAFLIQMPCMRSAHRDHFCTPQATRRPACSHCVTSHFHGTLVRCLGNPTGHSFFQRHTWKHPCVQHRSLHPAACLQRKECKDWVALYDYASGSGWGVRSRFLVDTLDAVDLNWSPDGTKLAIWDSPLAYKVSCRMSRIMAPQAAALEPWGSVT